MRLAPGQIIAQQQVEHLRRALDILRHDADELARVGVHGREPHHLGIVLAETFRAVDVRLRAAEAVDDGRLLAVGIGKVGLALAHDLIQGRLGDVHISLADQRRGEAVEHGEDERADLEAVHVGIGADDDLVPAQVLKAERREVLSLLALHLHAAAEHAHEVGDNVALKNARIISLEAVEDLAAHGHDALKLRIAREFARAECGVALHDVDLAA